MTTRRVWRRGSWRTSRRPCPSSSTSRHSISSTSWTPQSKTQANSNLLSSLIMQGVPKKLDPCSNSLLKSLQMEKVGGFRKIQHNCCIAGRKHPIFFNLWWMLKDFFGHPVIHTRRHLRTKLQINNMHYDLLRTPDEVYAEVETILKAFQ